MPQTGKPADQPEIDSGKTITFPQGIPGFETYTKFVIFHKQEKSSGVYWLESVDSPTVTFTLVDPTDYGLNYALELTDEEEAVLEAEQPEKLAILMMLSKKQEGDLKVPALHANIVGPIVINLEKRLGIQKVLTRAHMDINIVQE